MLSFPFLFLNYNKGVLYVLQFKIIIFCWDVCIPSVPPLHAADRWDILGHKTDPYFFFWLSSLVSQRVFSCPTCPG